MNSRPAPRYRRPVRAAFTLIELLIVLGIIAVLTGMLMPALAGAREASYRAHCLSNLHQIGASITAYAMNYSGSIPFGPKAPPTNPLSFYPATGDVTSLISLQSGKPVGLGLLLKNELAATPRAIFCPGVDQPDTADAQLAGVGVRQSQSDYYYRHAGNTAFTDDETAPPPPPSHIRLAALGMNENGAPIRALAMDVNYNVPADPTLALFGVVPRTSHHQRVVCTLFADGHAEPLDNADRSMSVDATNVYYSLINIRRAFERADVR